MKRPSVLIFVCLEILVFSDGIPVYIDPATVIKPEHLVRINHDQQNVQIPLDPRPPPEVTDIDVKSFLEDLGYLNDTGLDLVARSNDENGTVIALKRFQRQFQLPQTGILDDDTKRIIAAPRCGAAELNDDVEVWTKPLITYKIRSLPASISSVQARSLIKRAFAEWSKHINLDITEVLYGEADIYVSDEQGAHRDRLGYPCQFHKNTTLAHAFYPQIGDIHFNRERTYSAEEFLSATMHEIGHSLGLDHTTSQSSIMFPMHVRYHKRIPIEDRRVLQALYGVRRRTKQAAPSVTSGIVPKLCSLPKIDTILNDASGHTFVLAGEYYYALSERNPSGLPISSKWPELPGNVAASFTYHNNKTFFFKGDQVWVYADDQLEAGYPNTIADTLPGLPNNLDAAHITKGGNILAFKSKQYWFYSPSSKPQVRDQFPRRLFDFEGLPVNLDAALYHTDGKLYFFKGRNYYTMQKLKAGPAVRVEGAWFKC